MERHAYAGMTGRRQNTRHAAETGYHHSMPNFQPRVRHNLMQENAALRAELQEIQYQQHQSNISLKAAKRKASYLESERDEFRNKFFYSCLEAKKTINDLKGQLEWGLSSETKSYLKDIHKLKCELREAHTERINSANRLMLADRIIEILTSKLDDANKKLQQQNSNPALTKTTQAHLAEIASPNDDQSKRCRELQKFTDQLQQLQIAMEELKTQAAKYKNEKEALCSEINPLKGEICVSKGLKETNEEKIMKLEKEVNNTKAFYAALLEEQKKENADIAQALQKAEKEKAALLMEKEDLETALEELTSRMSLLNQESEEQTSCCPFRLFS